MSHESIYRIAREAGLMDRHDNSDEWFVRSDIDERTVIEFSRLVTAEAGWLVECGDGITADPGPRTTSKGDAGTDHITLPRAVVQQALEAICGAKLCEFNSMSSRREMVRLMDEAITALRAALAEPVAKLVKHGCYLDLDPDMEPDGCVLDEGLPENCALARRLLRDGKGKTDCGYWKPIKVKR